MTETPIDPERQLRSIVVESPEFVHVFDSFGINYYSSGNTTLEEACERQGLDVSMVSERLATVWTQDKEQRNEWESLTVLIDDIRTTHHRFLRNEVSLLVNFIRERRHTQDTKNPELGKLEREFSELAAELQSHISMVETDVFPCIKKLDENQPLEGAELEMLREGLSDIRTYHENSTDHLERISKVCDEIREGRNSPPWQQELYSRFETVQRNTRLHIHKESNILFHRTERQLDRNEFELLVPYPSVHHSLLQSLDSTRDPPYHGNPNQ